MSVSGGETELLQTEGTVILHISFALKQGQELRKEYLKLLEVSWCTAFFCHCVVLLIKYCRLLKQSSPVVCSLPSVLLSLFL